MTKTTREMLLHMLLNRVEQRKIRLYRMDQIVGGTLR